MKHGRLLLVLVLALPAASFDSSEVARKLENALQSLRSLQADFEQAYYSMSVSTPQKEKGKFYLEKPDRMRWEYRPPDEKIFIYKAGALEEYYPEDKQLIRRFLAGEQNEAETLALLAGRKRIQDNYLIEETLFPSDNKSSRQLKLTPNQEGEYSYILLEIDERTWLIRRAIFFEWTGNKMEFLFSKMKANAPLPSGIFDLKVPPDCEIIEDDSLRKK